MSAVDVAVPVVLNVECGGASAATQALTLAARETRTTLVALPPSGATNCLIALLWEAREIDQEVLDLPAEDAGVDAGLFIRLVALETFDAGVIVSNQQHPARRYLLLRNDDPERTSPAMQLPLETNCDRLSATLDLPELGPGDAGLARMNLSTMVGIAPQLCRMWGTSGDTSVSYLLFHHSGPLPPVLLAFPLTVSCAQRSVVIQNTEVFDVHGYFDTPVILPEDAGVRLLEDWVERELPEGQSMTLQFECDPGAPPADLQINSNFPQLRIGIQP